MVLINIKTLKGLHLSYKTNHLTFFDRKTILTV